MGKILITERQLQLLTTLVIKEQVTKNPKPDSFADVDQSDSERDEKKYKHGSSSEVGEFKTYLDGDPYKLFK